MFYPALTLAFLPQSLSRFWVKPKLIWLGCRSPIVFAFNWLSRNLLVLNLPSTPMFWKNLVGELCSRNQKGAKFDQTNKHLPDLFSSLPLSLPPSLPSLPPLSLPPLSLSIYLSLSPYLFVHAEIMQTYIFTYKHFRERERRERERDTVYIHCRCMDIIPFIL